MRDAIGYTGNAVVHNDVTARMIAPILGAGRLSLVSRETSFNSAARARRS